MLENLRKHESLEVLFSHFCVFMMIKAQVGLSQSLIKSLEQTHGEAIMNALSTSDESLNTRLSLLENVKPN